MSSDIPDPAWRHFQFRATLTGDTGTVHHPWVSQEYHPDHGWRTPRMHKRITASWARTLRAQGITHVELTSGPRGQSYRRLSAAVARQLPVADFTTAELSRRPATTSAERTRR